MTRRGRRSIKFTWSHEKWIQNQVWKKRERENQNWSHFALTRKELVSIQYKILERKQGNWWRFFQSVRIMSICSRISTNWRSFFVEQETGIHAMTARGWHMLFRQLEKKKDLHLSWSAKIKNLNTNT